MEVVVAKAKLQPRFGRASIGRLGNRTRPLAEGH